MPDPWRSSGYHLLDRSADRQLAVTDDFLRAYLQRPEIRPLPESCEAERTLHARLMQAPRDAAAADALAAIADADTRENYRLLLRFRDRLLSAGSIERCYLALFRGDRIDIPPLFIDQLAQVILRGALEDCEDALAWRSAELFFREQRATRRDGQLLLADLETVEMHASGHRYGSLGRLIVEAQGTLAGMDLTVLSPDNRERYWAQESRFDTVLAFSTGSAAQTAFARVIERWIAHFLGAELRVTPLDSIDAAHWRWHVGLDAEATSILNDLWRGDEIEPGRLRRLLALFRLDAKHPGTLRAEVQGSPVVLALAADEHDVVRMKPQNLLVNLPLAQRL